MSTILPEMLGMPWEDIVAKGHAAIDSLFATNQAAQYHDESLKEKLFRAGVDVATLTPGLLAKIAQGAARGVEALNMGEKIAYVSEELGLARAAEFLKPVGAVEGIEVNTLKNVVADEIRVLKNVETTEAGIASLTEKDFITRGALEKTTLDAAQNEKEIFNFSHAAAKHMHDVHRTVPSQILDKIIKVPMAVVKDPRGASDAIMYYSQIWKNGKLYNIEVLYDKGTNTISHFKYSPDPMGPLKRIR